MILLLLHCTEQPRKARPSSASMGEEFKPDGCVEFSNGDVDEDDPIKRTGTLWTASAHIITSVIGSGVLSLAWAVAQLGWGGGLAALLACSLITWFCATLLVDCYRYPGPMHGKRNKCYVDAVRAHLGEKMAQICAWVQYVNLVALNIGFTITAAISMGAVQRSNCFHRKGHVAACHASTPVYVTAFSALQLVLCQMPNLHKLWWLSYIAAAMAFIYSSIGLGLSISKIAELGLVKTTLTGTTVGVDVTGREKVWRSLQAVGNIAFAYSYSNVLIEIEDTLKSSPPESKVMRKASAIGTSITTFYYMLCGALGYAAFGNNAPGNFLTGFGFYEPFWLIDIGNVCVAIHLLGTYQVFCQPIFQFVEGWSIKKWPGSRLLTAEKTITVPFLGAHCLNLFRLVWRTVYVVMVAVVAMIIPFFNDFQGFVGAIGYWPLTVYFPVEMYIKQAKVSKFSATWAWLMVLQVGCLIVSITAACGSVQGLVQDLGRSNPFKFS